MTKFCTMCGTQLDDDAAFCTNCGAQAEPAESSEPSIEEVTAVEAGVESVAAFEEQATTVVPPVAQQDTASPEPTATQSAPAYQATPQAAMPAQTAVMPPVQAAQPAAQPVQQAQPAQPAPQKSNKGPIIGIIVAVVVIVAALIIGFVVLGGQGKDSGSATQNQSQQGKANTYEVIYETGGGSSISVTVVEPGESVTTPEEPTRTGYTFDGWYLDQGYKQKAKFPLKIEADTVLYAKWNENKAEASNGKEASDVSLSVVGQDGTTRTATIHRDGKTGRVFPNSNNEALSESEVRALSDAERCVAWNEIIAAANGYEFKNSGLKTYFNDYCAWYTPDSGSNGSGNLSSTANKNIELLKRYTESWWKNLATH